MIAIVGGGRHHSEQSEHARKHIGEKAATALQRAFMKILSMAALAALVFLCTSPAKAFEFAVDCSSTDFKFSDPAYNVDCETVVSLDGGGAADVMSVTNNERTIFFTMVERRISGEQHLYLQYRRLRENFNAMFKEDGVKDWRSLDKKAGYEVAEFSQDISGQDSHCIAVQRYSNPMYTGYKRQLVGVGCTVGDLQSVYQILQRMDGD
jgi:hypothetical protein